MMCSSSFRKLVFFMVLYRSFIDCNIIPKAELKGHEIVVGKAFNYKWNEGAKSYELVTTESHKVPLRDLRSMDEKPNLKTDGFTYVSDRPTIDGADFKKQKGRNKLKPFLEKDSIQLVKDLTGSKSAIAFGSVYRDASSVGTNEIIPAIHSDMSPEGAIYFKTGFQQKLLASKDPSEVKFGQKMKKGKDVMILNVWRPLKIVQDNPLGICKWSSLLKQDAINFDRKIEATNALNSFQAWKYREGQQWFYISQQTPDQAYIFVQHDSRDGHGINVPHASFTLEDKQARKPTRISFETRIVALVDSPSQGGKFSLE
ncbi:uncharacterized protein MELLADRAFT_64152 [Melampsora larici-populina 98AG31]|uniref:Secreted protein n=1 Tax=Melampsora larici-populina (strain 98AG31 / pathotype 3-4-7) TaxID=747676 RepID=F4RQ75_MELLP|nr:uncharacterized protein MELLADRAFT_64152 [Melampsora larici-populina 98AG31]EGG05453.1 hypothetical protein MELLADRAFT_64152 [Melampsora larici-populina 98AG31]